MDFERKEINRTRLLAQRLYDLFIVNNTVIAVQDADGAYRTKYISPFDSSLLAMMLTQKESLGCYQQTTFGKIRWICLDFDIRDKSAEGETRNRLLGRLHNDVISYIKAYLDCHHISYLTEYSGRRGIHVWIIFSKPISKGQGFFLVQKVCKEIGIQEKLGNTFGLDKFPATDSAKGNKVGKQVKVPLSCHKKGGHSYFFNGDFIFSNDVDLDEQYEILCKYEPNNPDTVFSKFISPQRQESPRYYKYKDYTGIDRDISEIIGRLSELPVFNAIMNRFRQGIASTQDFLVLLGTFTPLSNGKEIFKSVLDFLGVLEEDLFEENYRKFHPLYQPATIGYLSNLYGIDSPSCSLDMTGFDYLVAGLGLPSGSRNEPKAFHMSEKDRFTNLVEAEIEYARANDELLLPDTLDDLETIKEYYFSKFESDISKIRNGKLSPSEPFAFHIIRREQPSDRQEKTRDMFMLNAYDRILTTHLALNISRTIRQQEHGYSYIVNNLSYNRIFYNWYFLWQQYIKQIETELTLPFWQESYAMVTDIRHFYDSVDYLAVSRIFQESLPTEEQKMLEYLIQYNESLMKKYTKKRFGVPQGPAYARILAELYINHIISRFKVRYPQYSSITIMRYVDDFFIRSEEDNLQFFLDDFESFLSGFRLEINHEKTRIYGRISDMSEEDICKVTKQNSIKYGFRNNESSISSATQIQERMDELLNSFDADSALFVFNEKIDEQYTLTFFARHFKAIMSSPYGRGSMFTRFYAYYFRNLDLLGPGCKNATKEIPAGSLNQYCFITSLYEAIRLRRVTRDQYRKYVAESFENLHNVSQKEIANIIRAIREWNK